MQIGNSYVLSKLATFDRENDMGHQDSRAARPLTRRDVFDLLRAGLVLAATVGMALIVPPKVLGAVQMQDASQAQVEQGKNPQQVIRRPGRPAAIATPRAA